MQLCSLGRVVVAAVMVAVVLGAGCGFSDVTSSGGRYCDVGNCIESGGGGSDGG